MAKKIETDDGARVQFWSQLKRGDVSMLWVEGSGQHPQPMSHFPEAESGAIWYITSSETDLVEAIGEGASGRLTYQSEKGDYQASAVGRLEIVRDDEKLDELWSIPVAAWFENGRDDPTVRLVRFRPEEAAVWATEANDVLVGLKLLRAGLSEGEKAPDISMHRVVGFDRAA